MGYLTEKITQNLKEIDMWETLDEDNIQSEYIEEGEGTVVVAMGVALLGLWGLAIWAMIEEKRKIPLHPKWKKIWGDYERLHAKCADYFPDESTSVKAGGAFGEVAGDFTYESYKANPKREKCQMTARLDTLKKYIKWVSSAKAEEVCKYNTKKKERCIAYVEEVKRTSINELRDLSRVLSMSNEKKPLNRAQFNKVAKILNIKKGKKR